MINEGWRGSLTVETTVTPGWLGLVFPNKEEDKPVVVDGNSNTPSHHHTITPVVHIYCSCLPWSASPVCLLTFIIPDNLPQHGLISHSLWWLIIFSPVSVIVIYWLAWLLLHLLPGRHKVTFSHIECCSSPSPPHLMSRYFLTLLQTVSVPTR